MTDPSNPYGFQPAPQPAEHDPAVPRVEPPAYGQPPAYGPPAYGQPPAYGPPSQPQPYYGAAAGYGPPVPPNQDPNYGAYAYLQQPDRKRGPGKVLLAVAAVIAVVLAGGAVSYVAFKNENSGAGAATPQKAVAAVVDDLTNADLLGVLDDLPPAERNALRDSFNDEITQLKRLKVLDQSADAGKVSGVHLQATGLTYAPADEVINDHVRLVTVTGGTLTISSDASKVPYTQDFLGAAFPNGAPSANATRTVDIAKEIRDNGGKPLRIGVQKVGDSWYASLMYTIVDAVSRDAGNTNPTAADDIAPVGQPTSDKAVLALVNAALRDDTAGEIAVLDPNEDAAVHEYGGLADSEPSDASATINASSFTDTPVSGGVRVSLKSVSITDDADGTQVTISIAGDCYTVRSDADSKRYCSADVFKSFADNSDIVLSADEKTALTHLFTALPNIGVVTTQVNGEWYVSPIRTSADVVPSVLSGLANNDLLTLIKLVQRSK